MEATTTNTQPATIDARDPNCPSGPPRKQNTDQSKLKTVNNNRGAATMLLTSTSKAG
jgi:hypothetical protein